MEITNKTDQFNIQNQADIMKVINSQNINEIDNEALERAMEISNDGEDGESNYSRMHNRHNRS